jgi:hypothetical protein
MKILLDGSGNCWPAAFLTMIVSWWPACDSFQASA